MSWLGIDHAFSFPMAYFERQGLPLDWPGFLHEFQSHCPTDEANTYADFVREGMAGCWSKVDGGPSWLRLTDQWMASGKSAFYSMFREHSHVQPMPVCPGCGICGRSSMPKFISYLFDGWDVPQDLSVVAEVYPSLWMKRFPRPGRNNDQHAAHSVAAWLRHADLNRSLSQFAQRLTRRSPRSPRWRTGFCSPASPDGGISGCRNRSAGAIPLRPVPGDG
jgi:hypothetical protein